MSENYDEISLRDLYLILKRGFPLIVLVAVLSAAGALLYLALRTDNYQAETTVLISPTPVNVQGTETSKLELSQGNSINWETYQTIAFSRAVLEETVRSLDVADVDVDTLHGAGELTLLAGSPNAGQAASLTISHSFTHSDPAAAAAVADAWAAAAVETAGASSLAQLESLRNATVQQLESLEEELSRIEQQWQEFQSRDESALIESRLLGVAGRIPLNESILEETERRIATVRAQRQALAALDAASGGDDPEEADEGAEASAAEPEAALALVEEQLPPETIAEVTAALQEGNGAEADLVTLVRRVELQRLTSEEAGLVAERQELTAQLDSLREQAQELRERQAGLVLERDRLERRLEIAQAAHSELAELQPIIEYLYELAPGNARILSQASVPTDPLGPRTTLVAVLAALVGGMVALLFVFLRAAVSEAPAERRPLDPDPVRPSPVHR